MPRILIVDDNTPIHEDFRKVLGGTGEVQAELASLESTLFEIPVPRPASAAFQVDCASQGKEGLDMLQIALAEGRPYAVAFVDGRMPPGWDGVETIVQFWRVQPELQVVLCTAYSDYSWDEIRAVLGESDNLVILKKPFDNVEVLQMAHALATKWQLSRQVQGRLADLDSLVRQRAEELRQVLSLFEASIAQSPLGLLIAEAPQLTVRWANAPALALSTQAALPVVGIQVTRHVRDWPMLRPDASAYALEELPLARAVLFGQVIRNEEVIVRTADARDRWVSVNAAPIRDANGVITAGLAILQDVTERRKADLENERLRDQVAQAQKMESVGRLAGGVAHDFNNMLQAISGYAELALDGAPAGSLLRERLLEIRKAAQRSADLTRQLLAFARRQPISPKVLDLNETITGMIRMLRRLIGEDIQLAWLPGLDLWPVKVDPSQIDQILANLTVNARDAIVGAGKITIHTTNYVLTSGSRHVEAPPGDYVVLSVNDTGCGMDEPTRSHLFEPFFTTKAVGKGTGLGLATVFGIVQQNLGFLEVQTAPGRGTTFRIGLPRSDAPAQAPTEVVVRRAVHGSETILFVEDEPQVLGLGRRVLADHGYTVLAAPTPESALALAAQYPGRIQLLIADVVMPGLNGKQLHQQLSASRPELRCLFVSGYTADVIAQQGVLDDGVHFLQKPFSNLALVEKARDVLDRV